MTKPLRVLLIEDSEGDATLLEMHLKYADYEPAVKRVETAAEVRAALAEQDWDIVISDYRLPNLDGLAALKLVQEDGRDIPFILMSGVAGEELAVAALKAGAQDYLLKDHLWRLPPAIERELREAQSRRQRRLAEEALRESGEQLRLAFWAADMGSWQWDFSTDVLDGDAKVRSLLGLPTDEPIGSFGRVLERTHRQDWDGLQQRAAELKAQAGNYEAEFRVTWPDGSVHWILAKGRSFAVEGRPLRAIGVAVDITERKEAEEELAAAKASAEHAKAAAEQANRAKDHFLAVLSHELRTPLTPVVMAVSMLQRIPDLDSKTSETLEMIGRNVELEAGLIDDLLDVTRIARGKIELHKQRVELCTVIQRAVEVCMPDIEARGLHFGTDAGPGAPYWIEADVPRLQQVFWNLLKNAIKFTPNGGCVGIRCRPQGNYVVAEVSDSGIGIEPEALSRVFNAFEQAERSITRQFGGLGLGLAISKALVEMHGGEIEASSEGRNKGTTFRIRLPMVVPARKREGPAATSRPPVRPMHILLVEDHGATAKMLKVVLTAAGHSVETAGDVATALELAAGQPFDLLLSDLGLPDGSGQDLMRQLRSRGFKFPAIALSGYGREEDVARSYQAGFVAHLAKPSSLEVILGTIAAVGPAAVVEEIAG
ncbi:MAG: hybrid sensor histidine kinase/response regulator [Pirellulales bacterium]